MPTVDVLDKDAQKVGEIGLRDDIFSVEQKPHLFHFVLRYQLAAKRMGTASTKTRSEVRATGRKLWRQKGTGRARTGTSGSPIWRGGGVVFGPGDVAQAHTSREFVSIDQVDAATDVLERVFGD